ncbi:MAG TPA: hypothetical protein VN831_31645 [Bradyrhizobium sp.]|nr:hypothetical protein [Bradyrhizobium sp.]
MGIDLSSSQAGEFLQCQMLLHCSGIATKGYGCNRGRGQFTFDDAKRAGAEISRCDPIASAAEDCLRRSAGA